MEKSKRAFWSHADEERLMVFLASGSTDFSKLMADVKREYDCKTRTPNAVIVRLWKIARLTTMPAPERLYSEYMKYSTESATKAPAKKPVNDQKKKELLLAIQAAFRAGVLSDEEFIAKTVAALE